MIANFTILGDLYDHEPFETAASPWNSYPWQIGYGNLLFVDLESEIRLVQTRWKDIAGDGWPDDVLLLFGEVSSISMFASLIRFDQWGNVGSDVGNGPDSIPEGWMASLGQVVVSSFASEQKVFITTFNAGAETESDATVAASMVVVSNLMSEQTYFPNYFDSNSERDDGLVSAVSSVVLNNFVSEIQV